MKGWKLVSVRDNARELAQWISDRDGISMGDVLSEGLMAYLRAYPDRKQKIAPVDPLDIVLRDFKEKETKRHAAEEPGIMGLLDQTFGGK